MRRTRAWLPGTDPLMLVVVCELAGNENVYSRAIAAINDWARYQLFDRINSVHDKGTGVMVIPGVGAHYANSTLYMRQGRIRGARLMVNPVIEALHSQTRYEIIGHELCHIAGYEHDGMPKAFRQRHHDEPTAIFWED